MNCIFPGSFNPIHQGHIDIIKKALKLFTKVYVVVTQNKAKEKNDTDKNIDFIKNHFKDNSNVVVIKNVDKLTADVACELKIKYIIRGLRNQSDFNFEKELAYANNILGKGLETVFLLSDYENNSISSSMMREIELYKK